MLPGLSTCYLLMGKGWALETEPGLCLPTKWISGIPVWIIRALSPGVHIVVGCVIRGQSLHFVLCSEKNTLSLIWNPPVCHSDLCKWEMRVWPCTQNSCFHRSKKKRREDGEIPRGRTLGIWEMPGKVRELKEGLAQTKRIPVSLLWDWLTSVELCGIKQKGQRQSPGQRNLTLLYQDRIVWLCENSERV